MANTSNYFDLENSSMIIILLLLIFHSAGEVMWLTFDGVADFEGPTQWQGANFRLSTPEEQLELQCLLGHHRHDSDQQLLSSAKLFMVRSKSEWLAPKMLDIKILARDGVTSPLNKEDTGW